jgi:hypothetical protein
MILKPQDIFVLLKIASLEEDKWTYSFLANELFMSPSEVHAGIKRSASARLIEINRKQLFKNALVEFIVHGIKYAFPPDRGSITRGLPTSYAGPPLDQKFSFSDMAIPVWPDPEGKVRGYSFSPLYRSAPKASKKDIILYEYLVLVDAIRDGRAREREYAVNEIKDRLLR